MKKKLFQQGGRKETFWEQTETFEEQTAKLTEQEAKESCAIVASSPDKTNIT